MRARAETVKNSQSVGPDDKSATRHVSAACPIPVREYNRAPLQQLRIDSGVDGWEVLCQEREELSGRRVWKTTLIHRNHRWKGEDVETFQPPDPELRRLPVYTWATAEERDAEIERLCAFLVAPLYPSREVRA